MTPSSSSASPFDDGRRKISTYLRLCGLTPQMAERVGTHLLDNPDDKALTETANSQAKMASAIAHIDRWAGSLVAEQPNESVEHRSSRGRTRVALTGLASRWPESFLSSDRPAELETALAGANPPLVPPLQQTIMTPAPFDLGAVSKMADETWRTFDKWPFLRGVLIWTLFLALLGGAFYLIRF